MHSFGAELFINKWQESFRSNSTCKYLGASPFQNYIDTTNYSVDSLNTKTTSKIIGVGLQAFYSLRYQIAKRWYISSTISPSLSYLFVNTFNYKNATCVTTNSKPSNFLFPNVGFISDISICFRFADLRL